MQSAYLDINEDIVEIKAEPKLFELYHMDRRVLLRLKAIDALQRKESAQALYTYIESLPQNPAPISMKRMRDRLNLTSNVYTQNHTVRKAMEQLRDIGYLDYTEFKRGRATYFSVHYRNPKLISGNPVSSKYFFIVDAAAGAIAAPILFASVIPRSTILPIETALT